MSVHVESPPCAVHALGVVDALSLLTISTIWTVMHHDMSHEMDSFLSHHIALGND